MIYALPEKIFLTLQASRLYVDLIGSLHFRRDLRAVFTIEDVLEAHLTIGSIIVHELYRKFKNRVYDKLVWCTRLIV
jgi:hypothetical protein